MVWAVSFRRTVLLGSVFWVALISGLHAWLNMGVLGKKAPGIGGLKISYLPVT